ncbi:MAG: hypothetical protein AAF236_01380 [Verrucomicrobiota bacterium]
MSRLAVLNPKGRDPFIDYRGGDLGPQIGQHPPVNFHAFAAASRGAFFDNTGALIAEASSFDGVLILIRRRAWISLQAAKEIQKKTDLPVWISWKECGTDQIADQLQSRRAAQAYAALLELAVKVLTPTLSAPPWIGTGDPAEFQKKLISFPTPYPFDRPEWDFARPIQEREGLMIGTREFGAPGRNHLLALKRAAEMAHQFKIPRVSVINSEKKAGMKQLRSLEGLFPKNCLRMIERPLSYLDYLDEIARHRIVFQLDASQVPGQVAGDCLLANTLCVGGSTAIDQLAFPRFANHLSNLDVDKSDLIGDLLHDDPIYEQALREVSEQARPLSFASAAKRIDRELARQSSCGEEE